MMFYDYFKSPIGVLTVGADDVHITALHIEGDRYFTKTPAHWKRSHDHPLLRQANQELEEYFAGTRAHFDVPLLLAGTDFQQAVWKALRDIPMGTTRSYKEIAAIIGKPQAVRAVGTAIGHNPICIFVPCHRVLASNGSLGGYVAGLERKQQLLALERPIK